MMQIVACDQNTPEWHAARLGIPTASEFHTVLAKGTDRKSPSVTRRAYLHKLAGEIITGEPMEGYTNAHMERGKVMEDEAREMYSFMVETRPERVGFIRNGNAGCSPDSIIGADGMLEIKTKLPHLLIDLLLKDEFPPEHKAQCQGQLWVAEREWIDIVVYWPRMPLFVKRAHRDEEYIATLAAAVDQFNSELTDLIEKVRRYGNQTQVAA